MIEPAKYDGILLTEIIDTWILLVVRLYERMHDKMNSSFFISAPQIISNLAFLISNCEQENTVGLRKEFTQVSKEHVTTLQTREIIDSTLEFLRNWNAFLHAVSKPGHILSARRAICHPKFAKAYTFNTFKSLRRFEVELKIFEGNKEVNTWIEKMLKIEEQRPLKNMLNIWNDDCVVQSSAYLSKRKNSSRMQSLNQMALTAEEAIQKQEIREEKKPPILAWSSHAIISIHPDIFDLNSTHWINQVECYKIHESMKMRIPIFESDQDFNALLLPTNNKNLSLIFLYSGVKHAISLNVIRQLISKFDESKPCLVRREYGRQGKPADPAQSQRATHAQNIYLPIWGVKQFQSTNIGEHYLACLDMNSIFYTGGFGDLAPSDAEPSASPSLRKISHIQHYTLLTLQNSPHNTKKLAEKRVNDKSCFSTNINSLTQLSATKTKKFKKCVSAITSDTTNKVSTATATVNSNASDKNCDETISLPFSVILWDNERNIPVFLGKITDQNTPNDDNNLNEDPKKEKKFLTTCCIC